MRVRMLQSIEDSHQLLGNVDALRAAGIPGTFTVKGHIPGGDDLIAHVVKIPVGAVLTEVNMPGLADRDWIGRPDICEVLEA